MYQETKNKYDRLRQHRKVKFNTKCFMLSFSLDFIFKSLHIITAGKAVLIFTLKSLFYRFK